MDLSCLSGAIFDLDGTLLDSNPAWDSLAERFLAERGLCPPEGFHERVHTMPVPKMAGYLKETFDLPDEPRELAQSLSQTMLRFYRQSVRAKPGALALLMRLDAMGIPYCVATASERIHAEAGLARVGIDGHRFLITCTEVGADKRSPAVFEAAQMRLGSQRETTAVFEDSPIALATAQAAGFLAIAVYDATFALREEEKRRHSALYIEDFTQL